MEGDEEEKHLNDSPEKSLELQNKIKKIKRENVIIASLGLALSGYALYEVIYFASNFNGYLSYINLSDLTNRIFLTGIGFTVGCLIFFSWILTINILTGNDDDYKKHIFTKAYWWFYLCALLFVIQVICTGTYLSIVNRGLEQEMFQFFEESISGDKIWKINQMQAELNCCGVRNFGDWIQTDSKFNLFVSKNEKKIIPGSCCSMYRKFNEECTEERVYHIAGCNEKLCRKLMSHLFLGITLVSYASFFISIVAIIRLREMINQLKGFANFKPQLDSNKKTSSILRTHNLDNKHKFRKPYNHKSVSFENSDYILNLKNTPEKQMNDNLEDLKSSLTTIGDNSYKTVQELPTESRRALNIKDVYSNIDSKFTGHDKNDEIDEQYTVKNEQTSNVTTNKNISKLSKKRNRTKIFDKLSLLKKHKNLDTKSTKLSISTNMRESQKKLGYLKNEIINISDGWKKPEIRISHRTTYINDINENIDSKVTGQDKEDKKEKLYIVNNKQISNVATDEILKPTPLFRISINNSQTTESDDQISNVNRENNSMPKPHSPIVITGSQTTVELDKQISEYGSTSILSPIHTNDSNEKLEDLKNKIETISDIWKETEDKILNRINDKIDINNNIDSNATSQDKQDEKETRYIVNNKQISNFTTNDISVPIPCLPIAIIDSQTTELDEPLSDSGPSSIIVSTPTKGINNLS